MRKQLEDSIHELQMQIASIKDLDAEEIQRLRAAVDEIQETLDNQDVSSTTLAERLGEQVAEFQKSHPVLTETTGRIADMLSQMGI